MANRIKARLEWAANPIMIKALYQGVHSKFSLAFFWILLSVALILYFFLYLNMGATAGTVMFVSFATIMSFMTMGMIPAGAFFSLQDAVMSQTLELVQVTGMSPHRLVRGEFLAAFTKIVLVFSVIGPFTVTSYLFGGIDLVGVLCVLFLLFLISLCCCASAICIASLSAYRKLRIVVKWGFVALLLGWLSCVCWIPWGLYVGFAEGLPGNLTSSPLPLILMILISSALFSVLLILFFSYIAANALTFAHNRSSARSKVIALCIIVALFAGGLVAILFPGGPSAGEVLLLYIIFTFTFLFLCSLIWITAERHIPQNHAESLSRRGRWARLLYFPFCDGPISALLFLFLVVLLIIGGTAAAMLLDKPVPYLSFTFRSCVLVPAALLLTYVLLLTALSDGINRILPRKIRSLMAKRLVLLFILLGNALVPLGILAAELKISVGPGSAFFPVLYFAGLGQAEFNFEPNVVLGHLAAPFLAGLLWYLGMAVMGALNLSKYARSAPGKSDGCQGA